MEEGPVHQHPALAVQRQQERRIIMDQKAIRGDAAPPPVRLKAQAAQGNIQITHVQVQLIPGHSPDLHAELHLIQLFQLAVSRRVDHMHASFLDP